LPRLPEISIAAAVAICLTSCGGGHAPVRPSDGKVSCRVPTKLSGPGLDLGPLLIPLFADSGNAEVHLKPGYPTSLFLIPTRQWSGELVLRGSRCSDGRPLRFWYQNKSFPKPPLAREEFARAGTAAGRLDPPPRPLPQIGRWRYTGYMLFSGYGNWRVRAYVKRRLVGTIVLAVTPFPS
jgi:hypothetical protein